MTDRTSDEDDHADYTDDHQPDRQIEVPARDPADATPDVADVPAFEPPD